jgi:hypothetical protein
MPQKSRQHAKVSELPSGVRRFRVKFASTMRLLSSVAFLVFVVCWNRNNTQPSDNQVIAILVIVSSAMGLARGTEAMLRLQNATTKEFVSEPGLIDCTGLVLSVVLLVVGCAVGVLA